MGRNAIAAVLVACSFILAAHAREATTTRFSSSGPSVAMTQTELLEHVAKTFPSVPIPERVAEAGVYDSEDIDREFRRYRDGLIGDQVFFDNRTALPAFTADGFRAVFPGYLRYAINNPTSDVSDYLASFLGGASPKPITDARLATMARSQLDLVVTILEWLGQRVAASEPHMAAALNDALARVARAAASK